MSAPLEWEEVEKAEFSIMDFTIENVAERIKKKGDLFRPVLERLQSLDEVIELTKKTRKKK